MDPSTSGTDFSLRCWVLTNACHRPLMSRIDIYEVYSLEGIAYSFSMVISPRTHSLKILVAPFLTAEGSNDIIHFFDKAKEINKKGG